MEVSLSAWPEDSVVVRKLPSGGAAAFLYKTPVETPMDDGSTSISGTAVEVSFPYFYDGLRKNIIDNFDYYWENGLSTELKSAKNKLLTKIKALLAGTDYKQSKWKDGALTDEEYEPTKEKRASWRAAYNSIEEATTMAEIEAVAIASE